MQNTVPNWTPPALPQPQGGTVPSSPGGVYLYWQKYLQLYTESLQGYLKQVGQVVNTGTQGLGPDLPATADLRVTAYLHRVTGTGTVSNIITAPNLTASHIGLFSVDGFAINNDGNISFAKIITAGQGVMLLFDTVQQKWVPISSIQGFADFITPTLGVIPDATDPWAPFTAYTLGQLVVDTNGNAQQCIKAGTSGAGPTWATTIGEQTIDGSVTWIESGVASFRKVKDVSVDNQTTTNSYEFLSVTESVLDNLAVSTPKIQDLAIVNAKIGALAVDNAKIANATITAAKVHDLNADSILAGTLKVTGVAGTGASQILITGTGARLRLQTIDASPTEITFETAGAVVRARISGSTTGTAHMTWRPESDGVGTLTLGEAALGWNQVGLHATSDSSYVQVTQITPGNGGIDLVSGAFGAGATKLQVGFAGGDGINLIPGAGDIMWGTALVALGAGAVATLGLTGGAGPALAAQVGWERRVDNTLTPYWVPAFR